MDLDAQSAFGWTRPAHPDPTTGTACRFDGIPNQVDQGLFDLVRVEGADQGRAGLDLDRHALFQPRHPFDDLGNRTRSRAGRRQTRQAGIAAHESIQGIGAIGDHLQAAMHVFAPIQRQGLAQADFREGRGHRFDRSQRVVHLVTEHADDPLPRLALLLAQGARQVGDRQQGMRQAVLAELEATDLVTPGSRRETALQQGRFAECQALGEADLFGRGAEQALGSSPEQALAGGIDQP